MAVPLKLVGSTRWLARAPLLARGSLLTSEALRDPDCRQLPWPDLLPSRNAPEPIQCLRIERNRDGLGWRPPQTDVNGFPCVENPCPLRITELVPLSGLCAKGPSLSCG